MAFFRKHVTKSGRIVFFWRAKVPVRQADGSIIQQLIERSTKMGTLAGAREVARKIEAEYHERANLPLQTINEFTFADAALAYMKSGGERRYLAPVLELIGKLPLLDITQDVVQGLTDRLKPGCSAATRNRQVWTPVIAVLTYANRLKMCPPPSLIRPKGHDKAPPLEIPNEAWFDAVMPFLSTKVRAVLLLLTLHGCRISEVVERKPADLDTTKWRLTIPDTKTGEPVRLPLSQPVIEEMREMMVEQRLENEKRKAKGKLPKRVKWLFGTGSRRNISRDIAKACQRAGVTSYGTHAVGWHSFATRVLDNGKSVKFLMAAGRWKTAKMPMQRYGHLEQSEVNDAINQMAEKWKPERVSGTVIKLKKAE